MGEISGGLVAVAHMMQSPDGKCMGFLPFEEEGTAPVVRLSDAEAIIAQKDAEILEQCRINGIGAERELALLGQIERQSAALKLAREALFDMQDSYAAVRGWKDSFVIAATTAIAAIDALEGEAK